MGLEKSHNPQILGNYHSSNNQNIPNSNGSNDSLKIADNVSGLLNVVVDLLPVKATHEKSGESFFVYTIETTRL